MSSGRRPPTVLCIATYLKGEEFLRECRRLGCRVLLLTADTLADAPWPRDSIDALHTIPREAPPDAVRRTVAAIARTERLDRIVALDDFDVELAAMLREYLRTPGMSETTARHFRDKLAMRVRARNAGILVPDFVGLINDAEIREWTDRTAPPWVMKPRSSAAAIGIKKISGTDDLWPALEAAGDRRADYLLERFVAGDVYHVDSIVFDGEIRFAVAMKYGRPPMEIAHQGGLFITRRLADEGEEAQALLAINRDVLARLGLQRGVSHTEFIRGGLPGTGAPGEVDTAWFFLETSARVGGAYIVDVIEAATGLNLWREWARLEVAGEDGTYTPPEARPGSAGIVLTLARQESPDTSGFVDPEIVHRVKKPYHAGLIVASPDASRVETLLDSYSRRFYDEFYATAPAPERPSE
jgi:biotin carboxylase